MRLRKLNAQGLQTFRDFLAEARGDSPRPPAVPEMLLTLPATSEEINGAPELEAFSGLISGYRFAHYLHAQFDQMDKTVMEGDDGLGDPGFWAAVSLFYFDLLVPGYRAGREKPNAENWFIPETDTTMRRLRYFRQRAAGSYRLYKLHRELSEPLLLPPAGERSAIYAKITDSFFYTETACVIEAINRLYFDASTRRLRRDWNSEDKPGTLPRLLAVVDQLDLTYDLLGISGETLLAQLPAEFDNWKAPVNSGADHTIAPPHQGRTVS